MSQFEFDREIARSHELITGSQIREFAVPHLVVDDVFTNDFVARINAHWPGPESFQPEVQGNGILQLYRKDYDRIAEPNRQFWSAFNEAMWPAVVSAVAETLSGPAYEVFGDLYYRYLSLDWPLTLMQADPTYHGHGEHTHFYHVPHWAFTMLLYIDPEDSYSRGTALHRALPRGEPGLSESSYLLDDLEWRVQQVMGLLDKDQAKRGFKYQKWESDYRSNRLFVFLDGPLALHSVPYDNPDGTPNPARAENGGRNARRRIIRSHVKIQHAPFYAKHSRALPEPLDPERYMRVCAPNPNLLPGDEVYLDKVIRPFYKERLEAYARAAMQTSPIRPSSPFSGLRSLLNGRWRSARTGFTKQVANNLP